METAQKSCPRCGTFAGPSAKFCSECGAPLVPGREARKVVTALFADVVGSTPLGERLDPEDFRHIVGEAVTRIVRVAEHFGGTIENVAGDGALALFGAPIAHEDDPERAVLAGLRVLEEVDAWGQEVAERFGVEGLAVRAGIETGLVVVATPGHGGESGAAGDTLNTAARLQSAAAPETVLVGSGTHRLVEPVFEWGDRRSLTLKGKAEPVVAYEARGTRDGGRHRRGLPQATAPLVGRDHELALARAQVDRLLTGSGGVMVISGEAGLGKTRLLAELRALLVSATPDRGKPLWLEGRCASYGETLPYWPLEGLLREWLRLPPRLGDVDVASALDAELRPLLGERADEAVPFLASLMGLSLPGTYAAAVSGLSPEFLRRRIHEATVLLLERLAQRGPVALAIEDMHWADSSSAGLAEDLLSLTERAPVLLVFTGRPEPDGHLWRLAEAAARQVAQRMQEIRLDALPADAELTLLHELLGTEALAEDIERSLLDRSEGNPLFLEEVVRALIDDDALVRRQGVWRFAGDVPLELPHTLEKIVLARVDRLSDACQAVLGTASVLGRQFSLPLLERLADRGSLTDALDELRRLDLIREVRRWPQPEYRFKHFVIREVAYNTLLRSRRQELHLHAAEALEALSPERLQEHYGLLAYHYGAAGEHAKAIECHACAAEAARRIYANAEALAHYGRALDSAAQLGLDADDAAVRRLYLERGAIWTVVGDARALLRDAEAALRGARAAGDRADQVRALGEAALGRRLTGDWAGAVGHLEAGLEITRTLGDESAEADMLRSLSITYANLLRLDLARDYGAAARDLAARSGREGDTAAALDAVKLAALYAGDLRTLDDACGELARIHRRSGDLRYLAWALLEWSYVPIASACWEQADERLVEGLAISRKAGERLCETLLLDARCWLERGRGSYGVALAAGREAVATARAIGAAEWEAWTSATLGWALLDLQAPDEAADVLQRGLRAAEQTHALPQSIRCGALLAVAESRRGASGAASELADRAEALLGEASTARGAWLYGGHAIESLARVRLLQGQPARCRDLLEPLASAGKREGWREIAATCHLALAEAAAFEDHLDAGIALARRALAEAQSAGLPATEWRSHAALAGLLHASGATAEAQNDAARARALVEGLAGTLPDPNIRRALLRAAPGEPFEPT